MNVSGCGMFGDHQDVPCGLTTEEMSRTSGNSCWNVRTTLQRDLHSVVRLLRLYPVSNGEPTAPSKQRKEVICLDVNDGSNTEDGLKDRRPWKQREQFN